MMLHMERVHSDTLQCPLAQGVFSPRRRAFCGQATSLMRRMAS